MAIALRSFTSASATPGQVGLTTSESPSATAVGDLVVVVNGNNFYALSNMATPTATGSPTMNAITNAVADGGTNLSHIKGWWYKANTAGAQTISVTETGLHDEEKYLVAYVLSGADTVTAVDAAANSTGASSTTVVAPSVSPATANAFLIVVSSSGGGTSAGSYTTPATYVEDADFVVGASNMSVVSAHKQLSAPAATGTITFTGASASPYGAVTITVAAEDAGDEPPQQLRPGFRTGTGFPSFLNPLTVGFQSPADMGPGIAVAGTPTTAEATSTTALVNNVPGGVRDGNLLIWAISNGNATPLTPPAGWADQITQASGGADALTVWYRIASSEPANYSTGVRATGRCSGIMIAYSGVDTVTPFDVTSPAGVAGTTATSPPAITPVTRGAWVLGFGSGLVGAAVVDGAYSSANMTLDQTTTSTTASTNNVTGITHHHAWVSGAFTPVVTCSQTTTRTVGGTAALRPATVAAAGGPTNYTSPQTATVGFTGADAFLTGKGLTAATVSFAGALTNRLARALTATLAFTGALTTLAVHNFTQALTAALSFTGAQVRRTSAVKTATVSFTGAQARAVAKSTTATVSFTGTQTRRVGTGLAASLSFVGALTRRTGHPFTATVSFTGTLGTAAVHVFTQALTATMSFTGSQVRRTGHGMTATVSFTGAQARSVGKLATATVSFTGAQVRRVGHPITATLSFTGALTRRVGHPLAATVSFTGAHATAAVHFFTQALTATVGFTGAFAKRAGRTMTATVGFTVGQLTRRIGSTQTAAVGFVGTTTRRIGSRLSAVVGFVGALLGVKSGAGGPLVPEVTLVAAIHDHTLTAATINRAPVAATVSHTLPAATHGATLTATTLGRTIEET